VPKERPHGKKAERVRSARAKLVKKASKIGKGTGDKKDSILSPKSLPLEKGRKVTIPVTRELRKPLSVPLQETEAASKARLEKGLARTGDKR